MHLNYATHCCICPRAEWRSGRASKSCYDSTSRFDYRRSVTTTVAYDLSIRFFTVNGGFMSYGLDVLDLYRRAASYVDRILRGAKVGELPIQQPTKYELTINPKTPKALGIEVPPMLLAR